ncbi:MAG: hypothetical protein QY310_15995 [Candidatus Jettenia sp. CY-1]|nr:MAG: hypothetical protein QY310_15995 [Candidatus Jettenia sp. CY-1]
MPYIDSHDSLVIPFNSDRKYHYWKGGQSLIQTLLELNADQEVMNGTGQFILINFKTER